MTAMKTTAVLLAAAALTAPGFADELADGKLLFTQKAVPPCAICHALKDAGAEGAIGPALDELKPDAARVAKAVKNGIGQMPAYASLSDAQVQAIAKYVAKASGAGEAK